MVLTTAEWWLENLISILWIRSAEIVLMNMWRVYVKKMQQIHIYFYYRLLKKG